MPFSLTRNLSQYGCEVFVEVIMLSWIREFTLKEQKKNAEFMEMLGLEPVSLGIEKGR